MEKQRFIFDIDGTLIKLKVLKKWEKLRRWFNERK